MKAYFQLCALSLCGLLNLCLPAQLAAEELIIKPRLCIEHAGKPCLLQFQVSWHSDTALCLYQQHQPDTPLLCQSEASGQPLSLVISQDTRFYLKNPATGAELSSRQVRLLRVDFESGEQLLNKSRNGWWLLQ